jgi:RecA-family ATPase
MNSFLQTETLSVEPQALNLPDIEKYAEPLQTHKEKLPLGTSAFDILQKDIAEIPFIIDSLLPEGYAIWGGKAKAGKSMMMLGSVCVPVVSGTEALDFFETTKGKVLYFALEDNERRIKKRLTKMVQGVSDQNPLTELKIYYELPRLHEQGLEILEAIIEKEKPILVVIDTIGLILPPVKSGETNYMSEYAAGTEIQHLALRYSTCILGIHHSTKMSYNNPFDELRGTGITAPADTLFIMKESENGFTLHVTGRDIESEAYLITRDNETLTFRCQGKPKPDLILSGVAKWKEIFSDTESELPSIEIIKRIKSVHKKEERQARTWLKELTKVRHGWYQNPILQSAIPIYNCSIAESTNEESEIISQQMQ